MEISERQATKLWASTDRTSGCWLWTGRHDKQGYGWLYVDRMARRTHRIAWTLTHGQIPGKLCVLHTCDNPPCINPEHLWLGTPKDNAQDRMAKGRPGGAPIKDPASKGVYWHTREKKWLAMMMVNKRQKFLGYFQTKEEAVNYRAKFIS